MLATITIQSNHRTTARSDARRVRDSNQAGAPLPIIPRRTTRSQSLPTGHSAVRRPVLPTSCHDCDHSVIDTDTSSSSTSEAPQPESATRPRRTRRVKGVRHPASSPPKQITPIASPNDLATSPVQARPGERSSPESKGLVIAAPQPLMYTPGMLRLSLETIRSHMISDHRPCRHDPRAEPGNGSKSAPPPGSHLSRCNRPIIRKKSGQPVKSSLKSSRPTRGNLSIITTCSSSKSEPPTPKVVHFDAKLEHVKLFLAEQKPLAVSRDGSPTDDTSGTDSDFPSFIYGDDDESRRRRRKKLVMRPTNMTAKPNPDINVALEDFHLNLDGTNILGKVRVRNIAFAKTVVVRFTFDSWQTTSEVTARYVESISPQFDQFSFSIRLNDLLARIEGKTLMMAIRYNVAGEEFWDNNHCQDYVATFTKAKASVEGKKSDDEDASDVGTLRSRLEQVASEGGDKLIQAVAFQKKYSPPRPPEMDPPSLKSGVALSSRYDFTTSLRNFNSWKPTDVPSWASPPKDTRSLSPPSRRRSPPAPLPASSIPWPEKISPPRRSATLPGSSPPSDSRLPLVSPREFDAERVFIPPRRFISASHESRCDISPPLGRGRNHHRGYSDEGSVGASSSVRRTPPGTPSSKPAELNLSPLSPIFSSPPSSSRYHSFPPLKSDDTLLPSLSSFGLTGSSTVGRLVSSPSSSSSGFPSGLGLNLGESSGDSELSTPDLSTPTSSRSPTPSPTDPFLKPTLPPLNDDGFMTAPTLDIVHDPLQPISPGTHYRHFLNKFCFFTGASLNAREEAASTPDNHFSREAQPSQPEVFSMDPICAHESLDGISAACDDSSASTPRLPPSKWGSRATTPALQ